MQLAIPGDETDPWLNYSNFDERMDFHLELVDLLGICSKGKNFLAETFCQRVVPLSVTPY